MCPYWNPEAQTTVMIPGHPGAHCHRFVRLNPSSSAELSLCFTFYFLHFSSCKASLPRYTFLLNLWPPTQETDSSHETKGAFFPQHEGARYTLWSELPEGKESWLSVPSHQEGEAHVQIHKCISTLLAYPQLLEAEGHRQEKSCGMLLSLLHSRDGSRCIRQVYEFIIFCCCRAVPEILQNGTVWDVYSVIILWGLIP